MAKEERRSKNIKEPSVIVKPLGWLGGLDGIHALLMGLIIILLALLIAVSATGPINITNTTVKSFNCTYGIRNSACANPAHTPAEILVAAGQFIAGYSSVNSSDSLLPYISDIGNATTSYSASSGIWYVTVPEKNPYSNSTFYLQLSVDDLNMSVSPFIQSVSPATTTNNYVASYGVVKLAGKSACSGTNSTQVYWFIDPYASGGVGSLPTLLKVEKGYGSRVSAHLEILYTQASQTIANTYGLNDTLLFGKYLFCASEQANFSTFANTVNSTYSGHYMTPGLLQILANDSSLNSSSLSACISTSGTSINRQAVLAQYYNITSTPLVVTDCQYQSIPQTATSALCASNSTLC